MTQPDFIKSRLPFINAAMEGKTVEGRRKSFLDQWWPVDPFMLLADWWELRIQPTPEEERLANNARAKEEWLKAEKRGKLEYRIYYRTGEVSDWRVSEEPNFQESMLEYRFTPEPAPSYTPWTFETAPVVLKVKLKSNGQLYRAEAVPAFVKLYGPRTWSENISYAELLSDFEQLDGSPCGEEAK